MGRQLPAGSRQGARSRGNREGREVPSLSRRGRRRHSVSHAARRAPEGRVFHPRLGAQPVRRLHRGFRRVPGRGRPAHAEVRDARRRWCRSRSSRRDARREVGLVDRRRAAMRPCVEALDMLRSAGHRSSTTCASAAFPFGEGGASSSSSARATIFVVEQNRDAQLRTLLMLETGVRATKLRSILHYSGLPMSAQASSIDAASQGEAREDKSRMTLHRQTEGPPPGCCRERARAHAPRLRGRDVDAVRRLRPRLDHGGDHPGVLGARHSRRTSVAKLSRHRLLVEDDGLLRERVRTASTPCTAACRRSRPARTPRTRPDLHRRLGRRRFAVDRLRPVRARDPPQREHAATSSRTTASTA